MLRAVNSKFVHSINFHDSDILIIAFGGNLQNIPDNYFEMQLFLSRYNHNKIFLKDVQAAYFHLGIPGISKNIAETAEYILEAISQQKCRKTLFMGSSAAGYAAILFGCLLKVDNVYAINPRTKFDRRVWERYPDFENLIKQRKLDFYYSDLAVILTAYPAKNTNIFICHTLDEPIDVEHAKHLESFENVSLYGFAGGDHSFSPLQLFRTGIIDEKLREFCQS